MSTGTGSRSNRARAMAWLAGGAGVALVVGGLIVLEVGDDPGPQAMLADGTILRVEAVTVGAEQRFTTDSPLRARLRRILPKPLEGVLGRQAYQASSGPTDRMVVWFSRYDPQQESYLEPGVESCVVVFPDGFEHRSGSSVSGGNQWFKERHLLVSVYPRREEWITIRTRVDGVDLEFELRNPRPWQGEEWEVEPIPRTVERDGLRLTLETMKVHAPGTASRRYEPVFTVSTAGGEDRTEWYDSRVMLLDVTGNRDENALPSGEPVWKVEATFLRNNSSPIFSEEEIWRLGTWDVPAGGMAHICEIEARVREEGLEFAMFAGPGRFEVREGRLQSAVEFEDGWVRGSTINLGTGTGAWSGQFTNPDSSLILVLKEGTPGSHFLVRARDEQGEWHEVGRGSRSLMGNREFRQVSWRLPADGGRFEIEVIPQDPIVAEYWIRPPEGG